MTEVKGWKCFDQNLQCKSYQFEVGGTYEVGGPLKMCHHGFHFHTKQHEIFNYYSNSVASTRVCEVVAQDVLTDGDKSVCRRITVVRELTFFEVCLLYGNGYGDGDGDGNGYGDGYGDGDGDGDGDGYGYGYGYGYGDGDGYGYGDGYGDGYGNGYGNGKYVFPDFITFKQEKAA